MQLQSTRGLAPSSPWKLVGTVSLHLDTGMVSMSSERIRKHLITLLRILVSTIVLLGQQEYLCPQEHLLGQAVQALCTSSENKRQDHT